MPDAAHPGEMEQDRNALAAGPIQCQRFAGGQLSVFPLGVFGTLGVHAPGASHAHHAAGHPHFHYMHVSTRLLGPRRDTLRLRSVRGDGKS